MVGGIRRVVSAAIALELAAALCHEAQQVLDLLLGISLDRGTRRQPQGQQRGYSSSTAQRITSRASRGLWSELVTGITCADSACMPRT